MNLSSRVYVTFKYKVQDIQFRAIDPQVITSISFVLGKMASGWPDKKGLNPSVAIGQLREWAVGMKDQLASLLRC